MASRPPTAVIMAAGEGTRLSPLTDRRPKPMLPVVNRPLLEHVIEAVAAAGIVDIVLVVGYERNRIQTYFGDGDDWGVSITYAQQDKQLGTAHAVAQVESLIDRPFLVLNGDRMIDPRAVRSVAQELDPDGPAVSMAVTRTDTPGAYGVVTLQGEQITGLVEKPGEETPSDIINVGVYGFTPAIFDAIRDTNPGPDGEYALTSTIGRLIGDQDVRAVRYDGRWLDVSYPWDLLSVTGTVLDREGGETHGTVAAGARVATRAHLAETAAVGHNAVIGRGTAIGANAYVGPNATVERSVVFPDATINAGAVIRDCIVGENATVGSNVTVPGGETRVVLDTTVHERVRLGGVIGDNSTIGGGAVLDPGTILGTDVTVDTGGTASGTVASGTIIRRG